MGQKKTRYSHLFSILWPVIILYNCFSFGKKKKSLFDEKRELPLSTGKDKYLKTILICSSLGPISFLFMSSWLGLLY